ncbi:MAG: MATE family efflux transporter [Anaerolineae bacterium]|nr:MATE family efflux transporter [Anaerolineae bacterium]
MNTTSKAETSAALSRRAIVLRVLTLAWPVVVEQVLGTVVGLVNTYIVSHLGASALAAVGLCTQVNGLLMAMFAAIGVGSTALVARHIGADEPKEAEWVAGQSLILALTVGIVSAVPYLVWGPSVLLLLGGADDVVALGQSYLLALGTTMPLMALLYVGNAALRGAGDTRTPMVVMGVVNVVNAVVSASLVYGAGPLPALGVLGAGVGAAVSVAVGGVIVVVTLLRGRSPSGLQVTRAALRFDRRHTLRLLHIGLPGGIEQMAIRLAQLAMVTVVNQLGTAAYAGHQLGMQLLTIAFMPGFAFSVAATTLVGQELGRGSPQRAETSVHVAAWMAVGVMCGIGGVAFLLAEPLLRLFTDDPAVVVQGYYAMRGCAIIQLPLAVYFVLSGALRGAGDTRFVLFAQAVSIWLIRLPLSYRLGLTFGLGLTGVWAAMILDMVCRAVLQMLRFRRGAWKRLKV